MNFLGALGRAVVSKRFSLAFTFPCHLPRVHSSLLSITDDDFTYVSDSDDDSTSESTSNRESVARERAARSAAAAHRHFAAKRRTAGGRGGVERRLNLGESAEIKKMLEQVLVCLIARTTCLIRNF